MIHWGALIFRQNHLAQWHHVASHRFQLQAAYCPCTSHKLRCMARSLLAAASFAMPFSSKTSTKASKTCDGIGCERPHTKIIAPASWAKSSTACMDRCARTGYSTVSLHCIIPSLQLVESSSCASRLQGEKLAQLSQLFTKMSKVSKQKPPARGSHHPILVLCSDSAIRVNRTDQTHSH